MKHLASIIRNEWIELVNAGRLLVQLAHCGEEKLIKMAEIIGRGHGDVISHYRLDSERLDGERGRYL